MARNTVAVLLLSLGTLRAATVSVQPSSNAVGQGQTLDVSVDISGVSDLYAFQFDLGYDPTILSAISVSEGSLLPAGGSTVFIPGSIDNGAGTVTATADTLIGPIPGVSGDGVLANIEFQAIALGTSALSLSNITLLDSTLSQIPFSSVDGSVSVLTTAVPEPSFISTLLIGLLVGSGLSLGQSRFNGTKSVPVVRLHI
jgi:general secretion pathway protein D